VSDKTTDVSMRIMNKAHRAILRVTGGRVLDTAFGMPAIQLHTVGRTTGERRSTMLTTPVHDDTKVVIVASKGGDDRHPQWYKNLSANPEVEITLKGSTRPYRARTASGDEKAALWPEIVAAYKGYAGYQKKTKRDIPVVICEPRPS
jgi:deazaflavin-dependent oxidoreductase (nitroreductase family)